MYGCNLNVGKGDEHTETMSWLTNTKGYSLLQFLGVVREKETAYES